MNSEQFVSTIVRIHQPVIWRLKFMLSTAVVMASRLCHSLVLQIIYQQIYLCKT